MLAVLVEPGEIMTHEDIAAWCGCAPSTIHRIEKRALEKIVWSAQNPTTRRALMEGMKPNSKAGATPPKAHKSQFGIIVICESEQDQKTKFESLKKRGLKLKVVSV